MDQTECKKQIGEMVFLDHTTNKWVCRICNKSVARKRIAVEHIEGVHVRLLSYPCQYCDYSFTTSSLRRNHVHANHRQQNKLAKSVTEQNY